MSPFVSPLPLEDILNPLAPLVTGRKMAEQAGDALLLAVKARTPVYRGELTGDQRRRRPGTLRDSIVRDRVRGLRAATSGWRVTVFTLDPIAAFVEWDTKPHLIQPRADRGAASVVATRQSRGTTDNGRAALQWFVNGIPVYARVVHHPGTKGVHMFATAALWLELSAAELFRPLLDEFARELVTV